jgi:hypothetical protein
VEAWDTHTQAKFSQTLPPRQSPQEPSQPSSPQSLPVQSGVHSVTHCPVEVWQTNPVSQNPQNPPQPSGPQSLPAHSGVQPMQAPSWHPFWQRVINSSNSPQESNHHTSPS